MREQDYKNMYLRAERRPGSGDFLLAENFVLKELKELSGEAVKLYLYLCYHSQVSGRIPGQRELQTELGLELSTYKAALNELLQREVLKISGESYLLTDLRGLEKAAEREGEMTQPSAIDSEQVDLAIEREDTIKQINDSFFQGVMPTNLYHVIDHWFSEYRFAPHVIYAIFSEAEQNQAVNNTAYVKAIADNWHRQGIEEYEDLNRYLRRRQEMFSTGELVRKRLKLRGALTHYQEELIDKWVQKWKFSNEIIDQALAMTVKINNPNLDYVDKVLKTWHEVGINDLKSLEAYLTRLEKRYKNKPRRSSEGAKRQNFTAREESNYADLSSQRWRRSENSDSSISTDED